MSVGNKALAHRWFEEVWNRKREAAIREMLDPKAQLHGLVTSAASPITGPEGFIPFWRKFVTAFPNVSVAVEAVIAEEDLVTVRCNVRGNHTGVGLGVEPTGKSISFNGLAMARIKDGKIVEGWNNFDFLTMYLQIGLITLPDSK